MALEAQVAALQAAATAQKATAKKAEHESSAEKVLLINFRCIT